MTKDFEPINPGFNNVFKAGQLSLGMMVPIESYPGTSVPTMKDHLKRVQLAESLGFKVVWLRDIAYHVPRFTDAGQTLDPFTYLGYLTGLTKTISLGIASVVLPLHHPLHVTKALASIDRLSGGRLVVGMASGDRQEEYPAMAVEYEDRADLFKEAYEYIRKVQASFPTLRTNRYGYLNGMIDVLPKAMGHKIPMLMTGYGGQSLEWNVKNADGWINNTMDLDKLKERLSNWHNQIEESGGYNKPYMQELKLVLEEDDDFKPIPIPFGFRIGVNYFIEYLQELKELGVNHLAINLRFNKIGEEKAMEILAKKVLSKFH